MEEVTADTGFEGRVLACRLEAWARSPPPPPAEEMAHAKA